MPKKTIYLVYQDCALCGDRGRVRKIKIEKVVAKGYKVEKLPFTNIKAKEYIHEAVMNHHIGSMPFYTDGEKFSYNIEDIIARPKRKRAKKVEKQEEKDGSNSESE